MANRTMYVGDNYPPVRFSLSELDTGETTLDLRPATAIVVTFTGQNRSFGGAGTALWPFQADTSTSDVTVLTISDSGYTLGPIQYNLEYTFADSDTSEPDVFEPFVTVTWSNGVQTFASGDTLTILAT